MSPYTRQKQLRSSDECVELAPISVESAPESQARGRFSFIPCCDAFEKMGIAISDLFPSDLLFVMSAEAAELTGRDFHTFSYR